MALLAAQVFSFSPAQKQAFVDSAAGVDLLVLGPMRAGRDDSKVQRICLALLTELAKSGAGVARAVARCGVAPQPVPEGQNAAKPATLAERRWWPAGRCSHLGSLGPPRGCTEAPRATKHGEKPTAQPATFATRRCAARRGPRR